MSIVYILGNSLNRVKRERLTTLWERRHISSFCPNKPCHGQNRSFYKFQFSTIGKYFPNMFLFFKILITNKNDKMNIIDQISSV